MHDISAARRVTLADPVEHIVDQVDVAAETSIHVIATKAAIEHIGRAIAIQPVVLIGAVDRVVTVQA